MNNPNNTDVFEIYGDRYYDVFEFREQCINNNLILVHQNIRSFNQNYDSLSVFLESLNKPIDVIVLTETWFSGDICSDIEGFTAFHTSREVRQGGGVSIYVREGLRAVCINDKSLVNDIYESCVVEVYPDQNNLNQNIIIFGIYRPPSSSIPNFLENLEIVASEFFYKNVCYVGDFNIDLIDVNLNVEYLNVMMSNNLYPFINVPTRVTDNTSKCLDHIWYNGHNVSHSGAFITSISDHYLIFCVFNISLSKDPIRKIIRDHSINNINFLLCKLADFVDEYFHHTWDADVNSKTKYFVEKLWSLYNECCPKKVKTISFKKYTRPWMTDELIASVNYKHVLFKHYKQSIIPFNAYNEYKNKLVKIIRSTKSNFYKSKFNHVRNSTKDSWVVVNEIIGRKKSTNHINVLTSDDGSEITDPSVISNTFCNYFANVAKNLDHDIPLSNLGHMHYMPYPINNSFFVSPVSAEEVVKIVKDLPNKGNGLESVPVRVYKEAIPFMAPIIVDLFNSSISEGTFPDVLKESRIVPIHKKQSQKLVKNYRPISTLHTLSKIFEKLMKYRVVDYLNKEDIIFSKQYGFRENFSTSDAIVELTDRVVNALDAGSHTIAVFLDLSKAFDTVNRDIMTDKLERLGFGGLVLDWFRDYLTDRRVYVDVGGVKSNVETLNIGLPQGSVSSPYLFSLYVNDMHNASDKLQFVHFADDTTVFMTGNNLESLCRDVSEELGKIGEWLRANRLSLNVEKSSFMLFSHARVSHVPISISIYNTLVNQVQNVKFLGVHIDDRLNFNEHINNVTKKLSQVTGIMRRISPLVPCVVLRQIYFALFQSHLSYGIIVWGGCGATNHSKLNRVQNRALSLLTNLSPDIRQPPSFDNLYKYSITLQFHKYFKSRNFSSYFHNKITNLFPSHSHSTRFASNDKLLLPAAKKTVTQRQFMYNAVKDWNNLSRDLKCIDDQKLFKSKIRKLFLG